MSGGPYECTVCGCSDATLQGRNIDWAYVHCPTCGRYNVTDTAEIVFRQKRPSHLFVAWLRAQHEASSDVPKVTTHLRDDVEKSLSPKSWTQKQRSLLATLTRMSKHAGDRVLVVPKFDYPLAWAANPAELAFILQSLVDRGWVSAVSGLRIDPGMSHDVYVTANGLTYIEDSPSASDSTQGFVAMSFDQSLSDAWKHGIEPAIGAARWDPYRIDQKPHADRIDVRIMAEIRRSRFLIADVTGQRPGVYFEAGFALGLGLPVLWSVREDEKDKVHFDTRQYNHIFWKDPADLRVQLEQFVRGIVGVGPK